MCREALHIAENVIHPRLPVIGVEALSRCVAEGHSEADDIDAVPSLFGHRLALHHSDNQSDQSDVESNQDNVPYVEMSETPGTELCLDPAASLSPLESRGTTKHTELAADGVCLPSEESVTEDVEMAALADVDDQQNGEISPASEQGKSDSVSFYASPDSMSLSSRTVMSTGMGGDVADETVASCPEVAPTTIANNASDTEEDELLERSRSEPEQSLRKRRYSAASSVNDGDDSESESGEIEVRRQVCF